MEKARDNEQGARYNDEVLFLDEMFEFHPEIFNSLTDSERALLKQYYLTGVSQDELPDNIFSYRNRLLQEYPELAINAKQVFDKVVSLLGINSFNYTSDSS